MIPVCQQGSQSRDQQQRLVEHHMVVGFRDLDDRCHPSEEIVHVLSDVRGDESMLGPEQCNTCLDPREFVGSGPRRHFLEDDGVKTPSVAAVYFGQ